MAKIIDNLFNIFSSVGNKKENSVLGIDVGSSSIKIVQLSNKKGRAVLQTYGEIALGPYAKTEIGRSTKLAPSIISQALKDLLQESNVSTINSAVSIPMRSSMVSVFKMPKMQDKQLSEMIPIEARKYIPVPISEVTLDWFIVPTANKDGDDEEKEKFIEAMVVAIHNDVLADYSNIVSGTELNTTFFEIEMFSTSRSVLDTAYNLPIMIVDIGAGATKVYITERGILRDSHIINKGSQNITLNASSAMGVTIDYAEKLKRNYGNNKPEQDQQLKEIIDLVVDPIFADANSILLNFQKRYNKNVPKIVLVGGGALLYGIEQQAMKKFGTEVVLGDPFSKVEVPAFLSDVLKNTGLSFTVAIGLALRKLQEL